jgi:hypothetical protein
VDFQLLGAGNCEKEQYAELSKDTEGEATSITDFRQISEGSGVPQQ